MKKSASYLSIVLFGCAITSEAMAESGAGLPANGQSVALSTYQQSLGSSGSRGRVRVPRAYSGDEEWEWVQVNRRIALVRKGKARRRVPTDRDVIRRPSVSEEVDSNNTRVRNRETVVLQVPALPPSYPYGYPANPYLKPQLSVVKEVESDKVRVNIKEKQITKGDYYVRAQYGYVLKRSIKVTDLQRTANAERAALTGTYDENDPGNSFTVGAAGGYQGEMFNFGLSYYYDDFDFSVNKSGTATTHYTGSLASHLIMAEIGGRYNLSDVIGVYARLGGGGAYNDLSDIRERSNTSPASIATTTTGQKKFGLVGQAEVGINLSVNENINLGLGYAYRKFDKISSGTQISSASATSELIQPLVFDIDEQLVNASLSLGF